MVPAVLASDIHEVAQALGYAADVWQTDRPAAIVWIRRAAQIAGQAGHDERALALALAATELDEKRATSAVMVVARKHDESAVTAEIDVGAFRSPRADVAKK